MGSFLLYQKNTTVGGTGGSQLPVLFGVAYVFYISAEGFGQLMAVGHFRDDILEVAWKPPVVNLGWL